MSIKFRKSYTCKGPIHSRVIYTFKGHMQTRVIYAFKGQGSYAFRNPVCSSVLYVEESCTLKSPMSSRVRFIQGSYAFKKSIHFKNRVRFKSPRRSGKLCGKSCVPSRDMRAQQPDGLMRARVVSDQISYAC